MALVPGLPLMLGAMPLHHLADHLPVDLLAALVLALMLSVLSVLAMLVLALLVLGVLGWAVLRMIDGGSPSCLCRCKRNGCEKDVHDVTP